MSEQAFLSFNPENASAGLSIRFEVGEDIVKVNGSGDLHVWPQHKQGVWGPGQWGTGAEHPLEAKQV